MSEPLVPRAENLLLVFHCGDHYVFVGTETGMVLTVTLSEAARKVFRQEHLAPEKIAQHAAYWARLQNRTMMRLELTDSETLSEFYRYYLSVQLPAQRVS